jgi:hypothetical protein
MLPLQNAEDKFKKLAIVNLVVQTGFLVLPVPLVLFCYAGVAAGANAKRDAVFWTMVFLTWPYYVPITGWLLYLLKNIGRRFSPAS